MENKDFRTQPTEAQYAMRKAAVKMVYSGKSQTYVAEFFGVTRKSIYTWLKEYTQKGVKGLKSNTRGRRHGQKRTLETSQVVQIRRIITDKCPEQMKLPFALWTRKAVQELIERQFGLYMPIRTVGEYLKRWGFTPQKPVRRAYQQQPQAVKKWLDEEYPKIQRRAKKEHATIYWGDETGLSSEDTRGRGYSLRGHTPVRYSTGSRFSTSMISAIANQGQMRFMIYKGGLNTDLFLKFLKRLTKGARRKLFVIVDNLRVHHAKRVQQWLAAHKAYIELFFLPAYSPERNPDEYLNQNVKTVMGNKRAPRSHGELSQNLRSHMKSLQKRKSKVSNFFQHNLVKYAA